MVARGSTVGWGTTNMPKGRGFDSCWGHWLNPSGRTMVLGSTQPITYIYGISLFGKRLSRKSDNVVVFPVAFHIAVQQQFKPLWSRLLLYELKPSRASFALCFKSLLMTLLPASVLVSLFVWRLPFDLSSKGGPASSYATAVIALRVTDVLKPPQHDKVETPTRRQPITWD